MRCIAAGVSKGRSTQHTAPSSAFSLILHLICLGRCPPSLMFSSRRMIFCTLVSRRVTVRDVRSILFLFKRRTRVVRPHTHCKQTRFHASAILHAAHQLLPLLAAHCNDDRSWPVRPTCACHKGTLPPRVRCVEEGEQTQSGLCQIQNVCLCSFPLIAFPRTLCISFSLSRLSLVLSVSLVLVLQRRRGNLLLRTEN